MIKTLFWDIDGTLLNFQEAERAAIKACFTAFGLGACTDEMVSRYSAINARYWKRLELGEITKTQVLTGRFEEFFAQEGIAPDVIDAFNAEYQVRLGDTVCYNDDSLALVRRLKGRARQYAVTNGTAVAQARKLAHSGLGEIFDGVFISDEVGFEKPTAAFFDHVFSRIELSKREETMIVGDSLTSDMRGGNNAGILCCWYNPRHLPNGAGVHVDYEIADLREIERLL